MCIEPFILQQFRSNMKNNLKVCGLLTRAAVFSKFRVEYELTVIGRWIKPVYKVLDTLEFKLWVIMEDLPIHNF